MNCKRNTVQLFLLAVLFCASLPSLSAQDSMQFNVPYLCPDGSTYVVHKCEKGPKFEFCYYQRDQNSERYNVRSQVANQMNTCKVKGVATAASVAPPSDLANTRWDCGSGATMTVVQCQTQNGQDFCFVKLELNGQVLVQAPKPRAEIAEKVKACKPSSSLNPPYLAEFPNARHVVEGMIIGEPRENVLRSIGALYQLSEIIKVLAGPRGAQGNYLPDEKKLLGDYSRIQGEIAEKGAGMFPGQQFSVNTNPYHFSRSDPKFGFDGIPVWVAFLSPGLQAQFAQLVGGKDPTYQAKVQEQRQRAIQSAQAAAATAQAQTPTTAMRNDPGSVAARKCLESGRSETECIGEGLKTGVNDLFGGMTKAVLGKDVPLMGEVSGPAGLRLSGDFVGEGFAVSFYDEAANVRCGTLVPQNFSYELTTDSNQVMVKIPIQPKPVRAVFRRDGKLAGPGAIQVAGRVVVGSRGGGGGASGGYEAQTSTQTQERQIDAAEAQNYAGTDAVHQNGADYSVSEQVSTTTYAPAPRRMATIITAPKTESCTAGVMPGTQVTTITKLLGNAFDPSGKRPSIPVGLRMVGKYSGPGGLIIDFTSDTATVECGEAHVAVPYTVQFTGPETLIAFQNAAGPFTVKLQSNGTLAGSGVVNVAGRVVTGSRGDEITYAPRNASCALGTLAPAR